MPANDSVAASLVAGVLLLVALAGPAPAPGQPAAMVKDINTTASLGTDNWLWPAEFVELGGIVVFTADDGIHGTELWMSDGTPAGTALLKDLCPGVCSSLPVDLTVVGDRLYFVADDGVRGRSLWRSDGTAAGTELVADLGRSFPRRLRALGGLLLFVASDGAHGAELWRSDGTAAGTTLVKDIESGPAGSNPQPWTAVGDTLYLTARDSAHGSELWKTDGTEAGTVLVKDINPGGDSASLQDPPPTALPYAAIGSLLLFEATADGLDHELWRTDGTEAGTVRVRDIIPGPVGSQPSRMVAFNGEVYFSSSVLGPELWRSDGTEAGTILVRDLDPGNAIGGVLYELTVVGDTLFFAGNDPVHGRELWRSDGTEAGTVLVKDVRPGAESSMKGFLSGLAAVGSTLLFFADDGIHGAELWRSDGTEAGTQMVIDLNPGPADSFAIWDLTAADLRIAAGGRYFFRPLRPGDGFEVWTSDGTAAGTWEILANDQTCSFAVHYFGELPGPRPLSEFHGDLLFQAGEAPLDQELWRSDGTAAGTRQVADLVPGPIGSYPVGMTTIGDVSLLTLYPHGFGSGIPSLWLTDGTTAGTLPIDLDPPLLSALECVPLLQGELLFPGEVGGFVSPRSLWKTDGTVAGTSMVSAHGPDYDSGCTLFGGRLYYSHAGELWSSDGTSTGTQRVAGSEPEGFEYPEPMTVAGGRIFFSAADDAHGRELWASDGTWAGTHLVRDIGAGPASSFEQFYGNLFERGNRIVLARAGDLVVFAADDGVTGNEPWASDGSEAGTRCVADVNPGPLGSDVRWLTSAGDRAFFVADDGVHGRELWTSDGTPAGTHLVADLQPGPGSSLPEQLAAIGPVILFSADDGIHGREPWVSDGSAGGTRMLQDLAPGPGPSSPLSFTLAGPNVYFAANDNRAGFELWAVPLAAVLPPEPVDTEPPEVAGVDTVPSLGAGGLADGTVVTAPLQAIVVTFSEPVADPAGDGAANDVTNPANYLLVEEGPDGLAETTSCAAGPAGDDVALPIAGVAYDPTSLTATLDLGTPLPPGRYRLFVCGTTTIEDLAGNPLGGGVDFVVAFQVASVLEIPALGPLGGAVFALLLAALAQRRLRRRAEGPRTP